MLDGTIYRGAEANISIHSLNLLNHQYSKSQIWLENGSTGQLNSIQAGWAVSLYNQIICYLLTHNSYKLQNHI